MDNPMDNPMDTPAYAYLVKLARRLGRRVMLDDHWISTTLGISTFSTRSFPSATDLRGWSTAPFCKHIGVNWTHQLIVHQTKGFTVASLIHEMGHVFASTHNPDNSDCDELDFLGWEVALAQRVGVYSHWLREMRDYGVHLDGDWQTYELGDLTAEQREALFTKATLRVKHLGSLGPRGGIRSIRTKAS